MPRAWDVIIVGLGAVGSAALRALARRGLSVLGLDRWSPPHAEGSTHGRSRIIREAYFEHPGYVPLVQRAYLLWEDLEREASERLFVATGGLMIGPREGALVSGALASAVRHRLVYEELDAAAIRRRFPVFEPDDSMMGVWEPRAGVLFPEACVRAFLASAARHGARVQRDEPVLAWRATGAGVRVETSLGAHHAGRLLLASGAWLSRLAPEVAAELAVERVVQLWFEPESNAEGFHVARCPISIWEYGEERFFYAFPALGPGVKAALHHQGRPADPEAVEREVRVEDVAPVRGLLGRYQPAAAGRLADAAVCLYTNTTDGHFRIGPHPEHPAALLMSACSGHGFKFAPVLGEIASDLLVEGWTRHDLSLFRWRAGDSPGAASTAPGSPQPDPRS